MSSRPTVAPSLRPGLEELAETVPTDVASMSDVAEYRRVAAERGTTPDAVALSHDLRWSDPAQGVTVFRSSAVPAIRVVFLHGGGLIAGNRFDGVDVLARHCASAQLEVWTCEYPLAPEANLDEMVDNVLRVVAEAKRDGLPVVLAGQSAGGGVAAAAALECRDHGLDLAGLMLVCPMLDDADTVSARQFEGDPSWSLLSNTTAWAMALVGAVGTAPGRREDLTGLPPIYLDTGSAEVFRDSITAFATSLWSCGNSAELHVWSGGFHGFDSVVEDAVVSKESHRARREWLRRLRDGDV
ncbi:Esterase/lipase [Microbacterium esteraromaticum]|uniref:Esterase/lipase n=1 Tax=Microbacterium esteraromaticum TaxID=57043 RepID=A0A1R4ILP3_9MICO|nr:alpha/beta hydrolase [Microbacterium esteraromaticum]SJN20800.1 Esterase/lipase [Microbacterium esteraromaticum]